MRYLDRPLYTDRLAGYVDTPFAKVLTGIRRCGKSVLLRLLRERLSSRGVPGERIVHLDFDDLRNAHLRVPQVLHAYLAERVPSDGGTLYVLLDEIQEVVEWEKVVNSLLASGRVDLYLTGSNSRLLASELATYIAGRYVSIEVSTLSFGEFVRFAQETGHGAGLSTRDLFTKFQARGGFPGLFAADFFDEQARQIVADIYASAVLRDVVSRNQIRSPGLFERVARYALDNVGNIFSARRVSDFLRSESMSVGHQTVADYLQAMTDAYILRRVRRFDLRGRAHLATMEKYYCGDHGMVNAILGPSMTRLPGILENIVHAELVRRGYEVSIGKVGAAEIDFVAQRRDERVYVQVSASILDPATRQREYAPLLAIADSYPKYVVTLDDVVGGSTRGVRHARVPDFLLDAAWSA
ncbi:MAG: ATP-binding protein [Actinomycetia bacterium]|nr:ATP-binding protein [Actinomycetes bacterium]